MTEFKREAWWQIVHTGCLPNGIVVNCVPQDCAAAWAVFHFLGMFGTSEAFVESIGSTLKRFAKSLSTARCVEKHYFAFGRLDWLCQRWRGRLLGIVLGCFVGQPAAFFSLPQF